MSFDRQTLWSQLQEANLVDGNMPDRDAESTPWYVRVMLGVSGWIGALFLLMFLGAVFSDLFESEVACGILGICLMSGAYLIFDRKDGDFSEQFAFVISMVGQALIAYAFFSSSKSTVTSGLLMVTVYFLLFYKINNFLHQVWSSMGGVVSLLVVMWDLQLFSTLTSAMLIMFTLIWSDEFAKAKTMEKMRALGYGVTLVLLAHIWIDSGAGWSKGLRTSEGMSFLGAPFEYWLGVILNVAVLFLVSKRIFAGFGEAYKKVYKIPMLVMLAILGIASIKIPGVAVTFVVLLIGFSHSNRVLMGLGAISTLAYMSQYYYFMEITLLTKSIFLSLTGVSLLLLRMFTRYLTATTTEEANHA